MKDSEKALAILALAGIPGLIAISALLNGFVLMKLWRWFIMPLFEIPNLRLPFAIGLALVVGFLTHQVDNMKSEYKNSFSEQMFGFILRPFFILLFGWIIQSFI